MATIHSSQLSPQQQYGHKLENLWTTPSKNVSSAYSMSPKKLDGDPSSVKREKSGFLKLVVPDSQPLDVFCRGVFSYGHGQFEMLDSGLTTSIVTIQLGTMAHGLSVRVFGCHILLHEGEKDLLLLAPSAQTAGDWALFLSPSLMTSTELEMHSKLRYQHSKPLLDQATPNAFLKSPRGVGVGVGVGAVGNNIGGGNSGNIDDPDQEKNEIKSRIQLYQLRHAQLFHDSIHERKLKEFVESQRKAQLKAKATKRREILAHRAESRRRAIEAAKAAEETQRHLGVETNGGTLKFCRAPASPISSKESPPPGSKITSKVHERVEIISDDPFAKESAHPHSRIVTENVATFSPPNTNDEEKWKIQHERWQAQRLQVQKQHQGVFQDKREAIKRQNMKKNITNVSSSPFEVQNKSNTKIHSGTLHSASGSSTLNFKRSVPSPRLKHVIHRQDPSPEIQDTVQLSINTINTELMSASTNVSNSSDSLTKRNDHVGDGPTTENQMEQRDHVIGKSSEEGGSEEYEEDAKHFAAITIQSFIRRLLAKKRFAILLFDAISKIA